MKALAWIVAAVLAAPSMAGAGGIVNIVIDGSTVEAEVQLLGGIGAGLTLGFDNVVGLSPSALGLSASIVSPLNFGLRSRLPKGSTGIPITFPVLIRVEPPPTSPLSFSGAATFELHTHNLPYLPLSPLRLFKAPLGGDFVDVTAFNGMGSYRVGGSTGGFSEFLIALDTRPVTTVIVHKFGLLQDVLDDCDLDPAVDGPLQDEINDAWLDYSAQDFAAAAQDMEDIVDLVEANAGTSIPDVWRATGDLTNCAGTLIERAATLRFSLGLASY
jgi:hypothetical protein